VTDLGGVDILVNNAGIARVPRAAGPSSLSYDSNVVVVPRPHDGAGRGPGRREVGGVLDVNLTGPFLCFKAVLPHMRRKR
jgi:NAD(P)-dependent dehydrogenase (short-subunit alcohol dehydrogenase family)